MTPISPAYTREDLIAMIHQRDLLVSDLKKALAEARLSIEPSPKRHTVCGSDAAEDDDM